jgi:hypothetical protein
LRVSEVGDALGRAAASPADTVDAGAAAGVATALAKPSVVGVGLAAFTPVEALDVLLSPPVLSAAPPHPTMLSAATSMINFISAFLFIVFFESPYL